jgi:predicted nucleic acid-binding Zn ribbon protein
MGQRPRPAHERIAELEAKLETLLTPRLCIACSTAFRVSRGNQVYCSRDCREKASIARYREKRRQANPTPQPDPDDSWFSFFHGKHLHEG